jgi:hypothetical protein
VICSHCFAALRTATRVRSPRTNEEIYLNFITGLRIAFGDGFFKGHHGGLLTNCLTSLTKRTKSSLALRSTPPLLRAHSHRMQIGMAKVGCTAIIWLQDNASRVLGGAK